MPSFLYPTRFWGWQPILKARDRKYIHSVHFTIRSPEFGIGISPAKTLIVETLIDGVAKIHTGMHVKEGRGNLYLHLLSITGQTAERKGLTW